MTLPPFPPHELILTWWGDVFLHQGGGEIQGGYDDDFYAWWICQVPALEKFPYVGLDFHGNLVLVLPPGEAWGDMGESFTF